MECYVNTINSNRIDKDTLFSSMMSYGDFVNLQNDPAARFDAQFLTDGIANLLLQAKRSNGLSAYPMLNERIAAGAILRSEYADFLVSVGYNQAQIEYIIRVYNPDTPFDVITTNYLNMIDAYYTQNFSSQTTGGFCSIFTGLIDKLFSIFGAIGGIISAISELASIEQLLHKLVDAIKDRLLAMVQGLIGQIAGCAGSFLAASHQARKTSEFYNDINIKYIKDRITDVIQNMGSKFEDLIQKPETIQYLIYRLCQLASAIEQFMKAPLAGLQNLAQNCFNARSAIEFQSNNARLQAVTAGAFRLSPQAINGTRERVAGRLNSAASSGGASGGSTVSAGRYFTTPITEDERAMALEIKAATKDQLSSGSYRAGQLIRFQSQVLSQPYEPYPGAGAKELNVGVLVLAFRVAKKLGVTLQINSGYRNPTYNASLDGAAKNSLHKSGMALDCSKSSFGSSNEAADKFIQAASQEGAGGIGTYNSFIHIDIGNRRYWSSASGSARREATLQLHSADKFRTGTPPRSTTSTNEEVADFNSAIGGGSYTVDGTVVNPTTSNAQ